MRLTGGQLRGRKVKACGMGRPSAHGALRATSSRVREAVFNIAGQDMEGKIFVDLYAGTGAMGMEAMSRGAQKVYFVESDPVRYRSIKETLQGCGCGPKAHMLNATAEEFLRLLSQNSERVDIFFLDPPYDSDEIERVLPLIDQSRALAANGIVLAEHRKDRIMPEEAGLLFKSKAYKYGDTMLSLYRIKDE